MINVTDFRQFLLKELNSTKEFNTEIIHILKMAVEDLEQYVNIIWMEIMDQEIHEVCQLTLLVNDYMNRAA
jgi:hypothetical protein